MGKTSIKFMEIVNRITGFSTPVFGVSWNPPMLEVQIAGKLVTFLEDKRALYVPYDDENIIFVKESVLEIRKRLTVDLEQLDRSTPLAGLLSEMRTACRSFVHKTERLDAKEIVYGHGRNWNPHSTSHDQRKQSFFVRSNVSDIFSPSDGENKPIDPAFPQKISTLPFRTENTRVAYQVSYSPIG